MEIPADSGTLSVQALDLDSFWMANPAVRSPQLIKINVEGAEMEVLTGAVAMFKACSPGLLVATHGPELHEQCKDYLGSLSYTVEEIALNELLALKKGISRQ